MPFVHEALTYEERGGPREQPEGETEREQHQDDHRERGQVPLPEAERLSGFRPACELGGGLAGVALVRRLARSGRRTA